MKRVNTTLLLFVIGICCFDMLAGYLVIGLDMSHLSDENGVFENIQVLLLTLTIAAFGLQLYLKKNLHHIFPLAGSFLCLVFILRELDVEKLDVPQIFILLGSGSGRDIFMAVLGVSLLIYAIINFHSIRKFLPQFFFEPASLTILVGLLFLVSGGLFDKGIVETMHDLFFEEILEVTGYYLMFTGTVIGLTADAG
jgi:hypothetical protein